MGKKLNTLNPNYFLLPPSMNCNSKYIKFNFDEPSFNSLVKECCSYCNSAEVVFSWTVGYKNRFKNNNFFLLKARKRFLSAFASIVKFELSHLIRMVFIILSELFLSFSEGLKKAKTKCLSGEKLIISQILFRFQETGYYSYSN